MSKALSRRKLKNKLLRYHEPVPYARGFYPPTQKAKIEAIGFNHSLPREYEDDGKSFCSIPHPSNQDDWLAQYVEDGQSYKNYLQENPWFSRRKHKFIQQKFVSNGDTIQEKYPEGKVYVAKVGDFESDISFEDLLDYTQRFLGLPVSVLEGLDIIQQGDKLSLVEDPSFNPSSRPGARVKRSTLETRYNAKSKHIQISVDSILLKLRAIKPHDALCLIGLTPYDLFGDESDLFVAGMASGFQQVAVFSLMRYNPTLSFSSEHWYDICNSKKIDPLEKRRLILQRACKLVVHELCHLFGIAHCVYYSCCMNGSGHLQEDFDQPMMLCPVDLHKLQTLTGFDIKKRCPSWIPLLIISKRITNSIRICSPLKVTPFIMVRSSLTSQNALISIYMRGQDISPLARGLHFLTPWVFVLDSSSLSMSELITGGIRISSPLKIMQFIVPMSLHLIDKTFHIPFFNSISFMPLLNISGSDSELYYRDIANRNICHMESAKSGSLMV
ncbi:nucleolar protein 56-like [Plakobranchus ocellatus]|uniref:Nucleolar protein 56-like n=1 Tax=Plakobranchus ocellatus TaxID=259542 RepID=A0AAV3YI83_9GAST|nr:nucleolar protein 56-like [Plakobranchus ocellatus]